VLPARQQEGGCSRRAAWFIGKLASPDTKILGLYEGCVRGGSSHVRGGAGKPTGPPEEQEAETQASKKRGGCEARRLGMRKQPEPECFGERKAGAT
jgi:hypothetical protein